MVFWVALVVVAGCGVRGVAEERAAMCDHCIDPHSVLSCVRTSSVVASMVVSEQLLRCFFVKLRDGPNVLSVFCDAEEYKVECLLHDVQKEKKRSAPSPPKAVSPVKRQKTAVNAGGSQRKKDAVSHSCVWDARAEMLWCCMFLVRCFGCYLCVHEGVCMGSLSCQTLQEKFKDGPRLHVASMHWAVGTSSAFAS